MHTKPQEPAKPDPETRERLEDRIDEALEESFPASDPPAVHPSERARTPKPGA